jgi:hypothetical protein
MLSMSWLPDTGLPSRPPIPPVHHLKLPKVDRHLVLWRLVRSKGWLARVLALSRPTRVRVCVAHSCAGLAAHSFAGLGGALGCRLGSSPLGCRLGGSPLGCWLWMTLLLDRLSGSEREDDCRVSGLVWHTITIISLVWQFTTIGCDCYKPNL